MGDKTGIEWTDATWNPTTGCDKVSPGCDNCYALTQAKRLKAMGSAHYQTDGDPRTSGPGFGIAMHPDGLDKPLRWQRPRRIFVNSMSDLFHAGVTREFQAEVFAVMALARQHTFQVLTKRPGVMRSVLSSPAFFDLVHAAAMRLLPEGTAGGHLPWPLPNVWVGTSVEDQKRADLRIPALLGTPAAVRFLSMEPLLGPVDLTHMDVEGRLEGAYWINALSGRNTDMGRPCRDAPSLDWVIVGGESGPGSRPMHPGWVRHLRDQAVAGQVAFHFKQWGNFAPVDGEPEHGDVWVLGRGYGSVETERQGEVGSMPTQPWAPGNVGAEPGRWDRYGDALVRPMHKKDAGRRLDGRTWDEWPETPA
jgi:protein gp37